MIRFSDILQALANLRAQKTRTLLTALGIVFGVGSVIGMLAIGSGAKEESLRFIEQVGVLNEQLMAGAQSSGGTMQDINNIVYIPLNTMQYRYWDQSANMKDELDG